MLRKLMSVEAYLPLVKFSESRVRIMFDKVGLEDAPEYCYASVKDYDYMPTTEQVQADVIKYTQQRYVNEGLEPPKAEDIDVSPYVIE